MFETLFLICAVLGGTVFVLQFVLAVVGFGAESLDFADDIPDDLPDDVGDVQGQVADHGSTWLFGVISFRTVVAALAFFGIAGLAARSADQSRPVSLLIALATGAAAMYGVHYLMLLLRKLGQDATSRIERSVGKRGTVYVPVPGGKSGTGKIQLSLPGGVMEYHAMTSEPEMLATGTRVKVVSVISPTTLEVETISETVEIADA